MCCNTCLTPKLHKKQIPWKDIMTYVTYCNIWLKCYINFLYIVADEKRSSNVLAIALDFFYVIFDNIKKIEGNCYSFFLMVTTSSSSSADTTHLILSFTDRFSAFTISPGIVVLSDFECDACRFAVDSTSNNFIPPCLLFLVYIFVNILYICCQHIKYM